VRARRRRSSAQAPRLPPSASKTAEACSGTSTLATRAVKLPMLLSPSPGLANEWSVTWNVPSPTVTMGPLVSAGLKSATLKDMLVEVGERPSMNPVSLARKSTV